MKLRRISSLIALACGLPCLLLAEEVSLPEPDDSRGVKLSDAMDSAAKGDKRDLGGDSDSSDDDCDDDTDGDFWLGFLLAWHGASYEQNDYFWQLPVDVRYSAPFDGEIRGLTHFTISPLALESEHAYLGLYLGGAIVDLKPGSLPDRGTKDQWIFESGLTFRYYLNGSHTALSPYVAGSLGFQWLNWQYRNPIVAGGDTIEHDSLFGIEGYAGIGISTKRNTWVSFFAEVDIGAMGYGEVTGKGFENDVFTTSGFVAFKAGLTFKF